LEGRYLLPGLIDSHSHLQTPDAARRALESGVTTIRVVGDSYLQSLGVRDLVRAGHIPGPEMICAGPLIRPEPGIAFYVAFPQFGRFASGELRGAENTAAVARAVLERGADLVKVGASERAGLASTDPRRQEWDYEEIRAVVEVAAQEGKFVAAHAHAEAGIEDAVRAGVRSIEHGTYMNDETMKLMKENRTFLVPTLAIMSPLGDPQTDSADDIALRIRTLHMQTALRNVVRKAKSMGIIMAASTDGSYGDGDDTARVRVQHDMDHMIECGFTPTEAIVAATQNGARLMGIESRTGTIAAGLEADLIVLDRNPLEDFKVTFEPLVVINNGTVALNRIF
jgi:imidazolonepropionase-like amidohydrolase